MSPEWYNENRSAVAVKQAASFSELSYSAYNDDSDDDGRDDGKFCNLEIATVRGRSRSIN